MKVKKFDIAVVGGGHAGIEAAVVAAKRGHSVALITLDAKKIGLMSCNPAIGGLAKGQLVREIDALGGAMGQIIDKAGIHFKMLNTSKGPAVQSPRAQADRGLYAKTAQDFLGMFPNITIIEDMGIGIEVKGNFIHGLILNRHGKLSAQAVILTSGTFLNGIIHVGTQHLAAGRAGELPAKGLTESLLEHGFRSGRLKTGTPPRLHKDSIDYSRLEVQQPDEIPQPFSFSTEKINQHQINCFIGYTNSHTHEILREGFDRSPMFSGRIKGVGPRYCPSIEDKIDRFAEKTRHQLFFEPEGYKNIEIYVNGFSTSLPAEIQEKAIRTVPGLEKTKIIRLGYAVEYDFFPPDQLHNTLETKTIENLYFAGQICGTSGYEEAAAQGFIAALNASLKLKNQEPFVLSRSQAYIGVLIDDLINKIHEEPYRMFTSRAEFRLLLRHDNADLRLMEHGFNNGLVEEKIFSKLQQKINHIDRLKNSLNEKISHQRFNEKFESKSSKLNKPETLLQVLKRPEIKLNELLLALNRNGYSQEVINQVEYEIKYRGYLDRQSTLVQKLAKMENKKIPEEIDYSSIKALSTEAREKLILIKPANLGQASRVAGVTPADLSVLLIYLEKYSREFVSRETSNRLI